ncbi:hypothetical protein SNEBB_007749 [Seison nebaliae]|nr:hypothetical protein SNEBB_007749 [Seison nebaliae]
MTENMMRNIPRKRCYEPSDHKDEECYDSTYFSEPSDDCIDVDGSPTIEKRCKFSESSFESTNHQPSESLRLLFNKLSKTSPFLSNSNKSTILPTPPIPPNVMSMSQNVDHIPTNINVAHSKSTNQFLEILQRFTSNNQVKNENRMKTTDSNCFSIRNLCSDNVSPPPKENLSLHRLTPAIKLKCPICKMDLYEDNVKPHLLLETNRTLFQISQSPNVSFQNGSLLINKQPTVISQCKLILTSVQNRRKQRLMKFNK